ncbi:MAG: hypothetical protein ACLTS1_07895 [Coprococcus sp.]
MTETLVQWFVTHLGGKAAKELIIFIISMIPILSSGSGISVVGGPAFKYPDLACNPDLSGREPDPNSVYPASDPSDFCMAAQDAPFPSACRKAGEKSDEQK